MTARLEAGSRPCSRRGGSGRWDGRVGASLAELLVALLILSVGGTLTARVLWQAGREIEGAELGVRASLFLSELHDGGGGEGNGSVRSAGPGTLTAETSAEGELIVRYDPPHGVDQASAREEVLSTGFREPRRWRLEGGSSGRGAGR